MIIALVATVTLLTVYGAFALWIWRQVAPIFASMSDEELNRAMIDIYCALNRYPWNTL